MNPRRVVKRAVGVFARDEAVRGASRRAVVETVARRLDVHDDLPEDFDDSTRAIYTQVRQETMTSPERVNAFCEAVRHVLRRDVEGAIVECGVWRGGSMMAAAMIMLECGATRDLHLFDTFDGMTEPTEADVDLRGVAARDRLADEAPETGQGWARAGLEIVRSNMKRTGYPEHRIHYSIGPVEETIPEAAPEKIAVLRLDTDWYESTRHELVHLWPRLAEGGVLIIDDYGHWQGARRAVDEHLAGLAAPPLLMRIDYCGRLAIKGS